MSGLLQGQIGPLPFRAPSAGSYFTPGSWPVPLRALGCPGVGQRTWSGKKLLPFSELLWRGVMGGGDWQQQLLGQWCQREQQVPEPINSAKQAVGAH